MYCSWRRLGFTSPLTSEYFANGSNRTKIKLPNANGQSKTVETGSLTERGAGEEEEGGGGGRWVGVTYSNDFQTGSLSKIGSLKELKRSLTKTQWKPHYSFNSELSSCLNEYLIKCSSLVEKPKPSSAFKASLFWAWTPPDTCGEGRHIVTAERAVSYILHHHIALWVNF